MKHYKNLLLCFLAFSLLFLAGCGIQVSTDLTLDHNFKGSRTITCFVSSGDIHKYFKGDTAKLDGIVKNNCPDCFEYHQNITGSGTEFIFELHFDSLEEYKTKIGSVLNFNPEITFLGSDSIFSNGIRITENFQSPDLLRWFEVLLQDEYKIDDRTLASIWDVRDTNVKFAGKTYKSEPEISVSSMEYSDFHGIDIYTTEKDNRNYERLIRFKIPSSTLNKHAAELENFFEDHLPENATSYWVPVKDGKNYELTIYASTFQELSAKTAFALNRPDQYQASSTSDFSDYNFFQLDLERMEQLDFSYFLCTDNDEVPVSYYYKPNSYTKVDTEKIKKKISNSFQGEKDKNGFYCLFKDNCTVLNIGFLGKMTIPVTSYEVTTSLKNKGQMERTFEFHFMNCLKKLEIQQLKSFFDKKSTDHMELTVSLKEKQGTASILQRGTKKELNYTSRLLFGPDNMLSYTQDHFILALYQDTEMSEQIDLSGFLGEANKKAVGTYHFKQASSESPKKFTVKSDLYDVTYKDTNKNNEYLAEINGTQFQTFYEGTVFDSGAVFIYVILLILLIGSTLFLIRMNPMKVKPPEYPVGPDEKNIPDLKDGSDPEQSSDPSDDPDHTDL